MNKKKATRTISLLILCLILTITLCACQKNKSDDIWQNARYTKDTTLGSGANSFKMQVKVNEHLVNLNIKTDKTIVGEALQELGILEGEEGPYGLYVKKVNGITADYDKDQTYWAFYIGSDYAMTGVDMTEIVNGAEYKLEYAK